MVIFENGQTGKPKHKTLWKLSTGHYDTYGTLGYDPRHEFYLFLEDIFFHQRICTHRAVQLPTTSHYHDVDHHLDTTERQTYKSTRLGCGLSCIRLAHRGGNRKTACGAGTRPKAMAPAATHTHIGCHARTRPSRSRRSTFPSRAPSATAAQPGSRALAK